MNHKLLPTIESQTGKNLILFLEDFCREICDVRKMSGLSVEQRLELEKLIRSEIIDKIQLVNPKKEITDGYNNF